MNKMNIVVRKSSLAPCSFEDVELGQVFYKAEDANKEDKNFYVKVYDDIADEYAALDLRNYYVIGFLYDMQVFSAKSDLLIDISKSA